MFSLNLATPLIGIIILTCTHRAHGVLGAQAAHLTLIGKSSCTNARTHNCRGRGKIELDVAVALRYVQLLIYIHMSPLLAV